MLYFLRPKQIASQVDEFYLFLDNFDDIPDYANVSNIRILRSQEVGDLGAAGKLLGFNYSTPDDVYIFADDDICYPRNFCKRVYKALLSDRYKNSIVGFHGSNLLPPVTSYIKDRKVTELRKRLWFSKKVDVVATCAGGFRCDRLELDVSSWIYKNMVDLQLALTAKRAGMDFHLLPRRKNWIYFSESCQEDSIFSALRKNDATQTVLANQLLSVRS